VTTDVITQAATFLLLTFAVLGWALYVNEAWACRATLKLLGRVLTDNRELRERIEELEGKAKEVRR
jgi:hypothetical protein